MALTYNLRDAVLQLKDNAGTPHTLNIALDDGDLSIGIKNDVKEINARGNIDHLRAGDEMPMDVSFTLKYTEMAGSSVTPYEFLTKTGNAAAYTMTAKTGAGYDLADAGDVNVIQLIFTVTQVPSGSEVIELPNFYVSSIEFSEGDDANKIRVTGRSMNQKPIIT